MTQQDDRPLAGPAGAPPGHHPGHFGGVPEMARRTGAPVFAADARRGDRVLGSGAFDMNGLRIEVIATPGHSSDSLSFYLPGDQAMVTGDTMLGRSAPAILDPDGRVDQMITSLGQIRRLLDTGAPVILPGHGPVVTDSWAQLALALTAREARLLCQAARWTSSRRSTPRSRIRL